MTDTTTTPQKFPRHVAIVMDGNGRWARKRGLPRIAGHKAGMNTVRTVIKSCLAHNISVLTLFAFSSENWRRPQEEVSWLMELFMTALEREVAKLHERCVRLTVIGDRSAFAPALQERIEKAEKLTRDNQRIHDRTVVLGTPASHGNGEIIHTIRISPSHPVESWTVNLPSHVTAKATRA